MPLGLTVGDSSTNYQKDRVPADKVGKQRGFSNNRGARKTTETFGKLISNAIGDQYQDTGKYYLRTEAGKRKVAGDFVSSGNGKLTRHSEYEHRKEYNNHIAGPPRTSF